MRRTKITASQVRLRTRVGFAGCDQPLAAALSNGMRIELIATMFSKVARKFTRRGCNRSAVPRENFVR